LDHVLRGATIPLGILVKQTVTSNSRHYKGVIFAFVISQQIKEVIANGHDTLNRLMSTSSAAFFPAEKY